MNKIFSLWLLDIAKYVVTALVLTTALTDKISGWLYYVVCFGIIAGIILFGILLYKRAERKKEV